MSDWRPERLAGRHDLEGFDSGRPTIDAWLREHARRADVAGASRTHVWTAPGSPTVVGFHAVAPTQLLRDDLPSKRLAAGHRVVPGYLLARLALDVSLQGRSLGTELLLDALHRIVTASESSGGRLVVVDALDDAAREFYVHHDLVGVEGSRRLYLKVATARSVLA